MTPPTSNACTYNEFTNLRKHPQESAIQWIDRVKSYSCQLTAAGEAISQAIPFNHILMGPGPEYDSVKAVWDLVEN